MPATFRQYAEAIISLQNNQISDGNGFIWQAPPPASSRHIFHTHTGKLYALMCAATPSLGTNSGVQPEGAANPQVRHQVQWSRLAAQQRHWKMMPMPPSMSIGYRHG